MMNVIVQDKNKKKKKKTKRPNYSHHLDVAENIAHIQPRQA